MKRYDLIGVPGPEVLLGVQRGSHFAVDHKVEGAPKTDGTAVSSVGGKCWNIVANDAGVELSLRVDTPAVLAGRIALVSLFWGELHEGGYAGELTIFDEDETKALSCN